MRPRPTPFALRHVATSVCVALLSAIFAVGVPAPAASAWTVSTATRTDAEVRAKWELLKPRYSGSPYAVAPSTRAPYAAGAAADGFRADGVNLINFGRYLAGLPSDVTLDAARNDAAQHGAVLLAASTFSHAPPKPADMDDAFYSLGKAATGSSNIGMGYGSSWAFQKGCLDDGDSTNIDRVGHRRWLLNPRMALTGIGYAEAFHTTYAWDTSRPSGEVDYDSIAFPGPGPFPVEFASAGTPWSVTLNPSKYDWDATRAGHTATIRRVSDGATWTMDESDTATGGEYFNANFGGYGVPNVFIFRPNPSTVAYRAGDEFDVTLSGGIYKEGTRIPVSVTFRTRFMSLTAPSTPDPDPDPDPEPDPQPTPPPPATYVPMPVYRFYNNTNGSHFYTASADERDAVRTKWGAIYSYEGAAYAINTANPANNTPLFRFYNKRNGSHFYTASVTERDTVIARWSAAYDYEGPAYNVSVTAANSSPMYRFYNKCNGSHFYTVSAEERDRVIATLAATYATRVSPTSSATEHGPRNLTARLR